MRRRAFLLGALCWTWFSRGVAWAQAVTVLPMQTRPAGTYAFTAVTVQTGIRGASARADVSEATDPLPSIQALLEGSLDGGTTWISAGGFQRPSAPKGNNRVGQPLTELGGTFLGGTFWNDTQNASRRLRGAITLGGSLRCSLVVTPL